MADEVATALRQMVLSGELVEGERITQDRLANELGVSTMPVREALLRLATEGLVIAEPNRSFTVGRNTEDDLRDMFWLHSVLAAEIASRAAKHVTDELMDELTRHHKEYVAHIDDADARFEANWQFFRALNRAADSPRLLLMLSLTLRYFPDILEAGPAPGTPDLAARWQRDLLKALGKKDSEEAEAASKKHARRAGELYVSYVKSRRD